MNDRTRTTSLTATPEAIPGADMPDMCHDDCRDSGIYYPHAWDNGTAHYECRRGHRWTCGWGHLESGTEPHNVGVDQAVKA